MKKIICLGLALSLNLSVAFANDAESAGLRVLGAQYNSANDSIDVAVKYKGGCEDQHSLRLRGCADLFVPRTCQVDVVLKLGAACNEDVEGVISLTRAELGMNKREFTKATLIIQDPAKKSKATIVLPIVK